MAAIETELSAQSKSQKVRSPVALEESLFMFTHLRMKGKGWRGQGRPANTAASAKQRARREGVQLKQDFHISSYFTISLYILIFFLRTENLNIQPVCVKRSTRPQQEHQQEKLPARCPHWFREESQTALRGQG